MAGTGSSPHITDSATPGLSPSIPTKAATRTKAHKLSPKQGPEAERIDALLEPPEGAALYRRRQHMIEPVFGNTKFNRRISRFHRRAVIRLPGRVAADRGDPQPPEALPWPGFAAHAA